ncbi:pre-peptidase C-terminal domain-containing protein [Leptolyngbya sp. BL0902]|uniref:pre-peptidase C-terminal domain-containing protein n=1 Tax=Leptolyngbya sp. BL0902 TaxID=1115757 RepID=UPI0018E8ED69|nr:pre-peptidase C-terminal domain-containing protein [Leptolyngbya sp. BL0902]
MSALSPTGYGLDLETSLSTVQQRIQSFAASSSAFDQLSQVFEITDSASVQTQIADWSNGIFTSLPRVVFLEDGLLQGAAGAYAADQDTIYLAASLTQDDDLLGQVWLEEYGHALDQRFSPGVETAGDEGERFRHVVLGTDLSETELARIRQENDWGTLLLGGTPISVELDNTTSAATNLGTLLGSRTVTGYVGSDDLNDFYRFYVGSTSTFRLSMTGLSADADVELLSSTGAYITGSAASGTTSESISRQLAAGTYFVRVYRWSGNTNYTLNLNAIPLDFAGNTLTTARNMGTLSSTQTFRDFVGSVDGNDYYRFSLGSTSTFRLSMTGLSADADVQLLNASGSYLTGSAASGTTSEAITQQLAAGTYYVRVYPWSGSTNYTLSLGAIPVDGAGNSLTTALNIGTLSGTRTFRDFVGSSDTNDYYRFSVGSTSNFSLSMTGLAADADVQLLNSSGTAIASSMAGGTSSESISRQLTTGTYYVRVYPYGGANTNYALSLSALPYDGAGNTLSMARNLGTLTSPQTFTDFVGSVDTNDYYRFYVGSTSNFSLSMAGMSADADVRLLNSAGTVLASSANGGTTAESISRQLTTGTYYVQVYPFGGANTNYTLTLRATPPDLAGNSLAAARFIGTLGSTTQTFRDFVGAIDTNDYYRFSVGSTSNFRLGLTGLSADADVQLLNSSGSVVASSMNGGANAESISRQLTTGTYYVRVYRYSGDTTYSLALSAAPVTTIVDGAGNSLSTARSIGTLGGTTQTFRDFVGTTDTNDYYRFYVGSVSNFRLAMSGLSADADVQLLNSSGGVIASSTAGGSSSESITQTLGVGTYYVRVYPYGPINTTYTLALTATPQPDNGGNYYTPRDIGVLSGSRSFSDRVDTFDLHDRYRFSLSQASNFSLSLTGMTSNADVILQDAAGNTIVQSRNLGTSNESITRQLNAGTYFAWVYSASAYTEGAANQNTNYLLTLNATAFAPTDRAGNTLSNARNVGNLVGTQTFNDFVGGADPNDYYRFTLTNTATFSLSLSGLTADADVQLLNSSGSVITSSARGGTLAEGIEHTLGAGTYFVRVYPYGGANTNYALTLTAAGTVADWFTQNLRDEGIRSTARTLAADGSLSRNDMLAIFRNAQDSSAIDANEVADLRTLVAYSSRFNMADHVRWLSNQVAQGAAVNMAATTFENNLVGRWFLGTVAPTAQFNGATLTYQAVTGTLFGTAGQARLGDIDQGSIGNCAFLAALGATFSPQSNDSGNRSSTVINQMIIDNGDRTYTMRFFNPLVGRMEAQYVTVDQRLAYRSNGSLLGARINGNVLWSALVERAYAQWREWREGAPGFNLIGNGDHPDRPLQFITGRTALAYGYGFNTSASRPFTAATFSVISTALQGGRALTAGRYVSSDTDLIVGGHAYTITNAYVNSAGQQRVVVRNPWGVDGRSRQGDDDGFIDLSFAEFQRSFDHVGIA